jgi:HlyD family type I secretion membrane fusion protein
MPPVPSLTRRTSDGLVALFRRKGPDDLLAGPISAFESETQAVFVRTTPYSEHAIMHGMVFMVVLVLILMAVVKLDMIVAGTGVVVPTDGNLYVQPLATAIIKDIKVHKGDVVKKGQVLAQLDPTFAQADVDQAREHLALDIALVARLEAEQADKPYVAGPSKAEQLQYSIWLPRQQEFKRQIENFDEQIKAADATIVKAQKDIASYSEHVANAAQQENMEKTLEKDGYGSKLKTVLATDSRVEMARLLEETRNTLIGAEHDRDALAQRAVSIGTWMDQVGTQLATAKDDLNTTRQSLNKFEKVGELIQLTAPQDAVVLSIASNASVGTVYDPGPSGVQTQPLFTLAPVDAPLEAEVHIAASDDGFAQVGDPVNIKLDTYPYIRYGTLTGKVKYISEGSFTVDENNQPTPAYFKARVSIEGSKLHNLPRFFRLMPGMTLTGDALVGKRTILSYIIEGGMRRASEGLREP